jgi:WD40 repeat protein
MELDHIIGYNTDTGLRWSKIGGEKSIIFASGGNLITMDIETQTQRFFFGHSAHINCLAINENGNLLASGQEGPTPLVRIWEYSSSKCISIITSPMTSLKCLTFSHDGSMLACVGKDNHNREIIIIWDITRVGRGEKPEMVARQISDFNILDI